MSVDTGIRMTEKSGSMKNGRRGLSFKELEDLSVSHAPVAIDRTVVEKKDLAFRELEEPPAGQEGHRNIKELYNGARDCLYKIFQLIRENEDFSIEPLVQYAKDLVAYMQKESDPWLLLIYLEGKEEDVVMKTVIHCLHSAIIAVRIGIGLKMSGKELENLAMRAFLHDVGMLMVSPEIIRKKGKLTAEELSFVKKHPEHGYRILKKLKGEYGDIAECALQEHERYDGSGYPNGLKKEEIFNYCYIVGISDMHAAMLQSRPYRDRYLPFVAVKHIIVTSKGKFPDNILKVLVNEFSAFPKGAYVRLNSNEIGKVIAVNKIAPLRPMIEVVYDADGQKIQEPRTVDLMKDQVLHIEEACFPEEVDAFSEIYGENEL